MLILVFLGCVAVALFASVELLYRLFLIVVLIPIAIVQGAYALWLTIKARGRA